MRQEKLENKDQLLDNLFALQRFGIKPGLERTEKLLDFCGRPHEKLRAIHVAGTNGKGTVSGMIASVLTESGFKTGLYTSPHISDFNERIRIDGKMICDFELLDLAERLMPEASRIGATFFEITTVMAFLYFAEKNTEFAVIETGLGGRFDSTNTLDPLISVITRIGLDHKEYLGETIREIASEKAGIIKPGKKVIVHGGDHPAINVFRLAAIERNARMIPALTDGYVRQIEINDDFSSISKISGRGLDDFELRMPFSGRANAENLLIAISTLAELKDDFPEIEKNIVGGLENVQKNSGIDGRLKVLRKKPIAIADCAHNPQALENLIGTIRISPHDPSDWTLLLGFMADKDLEQMIESVIPIASKIILTKPKIKRAAEPKTIAEILMKKDFKNYEIIKNPEKAYEKAISGNNKLLVSGSFYLLGDLSKVW